MEDRSTGKGAVSRSQEAAAELTALVRVAQAGDARAADELIARHLPLIYNFVGRALNGHADVDDVVQETMIRVVRSLPELREPERFRSWLVAIAYRQIQQHLRDRRKALLRRLDLTPELPDPDSDFTQRTLAELELTGQRRELVEATRWLDGRDRQLLSLWWLEAAGELTRGELAAALAMRRSHVAVSLQRVRTRLDEARVVVRALRAEPRCPELSRLLTGWDGRTDARWRKRLTRHTRGCPHCGPRRHGLVAPEDLLPGISLPLPAAATEGLRAALDAAASTALAPAAAGAGPSIVHFVLAQLQGVAHKKAAAAAAAVVVGSGLVYAIQETPAPSEVPPGVAAPTATPVAPGSAAPAPGPVPAPAAGPTPTPRSAPTGVSTADVYVAPDGSDGGDGSIDQPFATVGRAVAEVRPGQVIALRGGTYHPTEGVVIDTDGEPGSRITLSSYRDERPVIDASQVPAGQWAITHRGSYWTVQGLEIMGSRSHAYVCTSCRENVFWHMSFHDNVRSGLTLRDPGTIGNLVLDSDFYRNYDPADPQGRSGIGLGIKFGSGTGNQVRGCRAFHNADDGFDVGHFEDPVTLARNWAYGNGVNRWDAAGWQANADGFHLGGGDPAPAAAHVVRHNAAWDNVAQGFSDGSNAAPLQLSNNTAFRNGDAGFHMPAAAAVLQENVAIGNASNTRLGDHVQSAGNTWDGGDWSTAMFRSSDPTTAEGRREPDGSLPATDFLVSDTGVGAAMRARRAMLSWRCGPGRWSAGAQPAGRTVYPRWRAAAAVRRAYQIMATAALRRAIMASGLGRGSSPGPGPRSSGDRAAVS